ncbi:SPOC domain / Transcription elongation factor S-II protein putative isoform 1 [Tripterygium wilfordii]|uniref:SPOC domain / Transcription elongation factor S-II protein putative isoform 1 n=2 Tax=Tripterygium wilfordii TaxID=458696 RepID=A0A7J7BXE6_TRIWF|nr:SPOC domain / Transcription elongation factor S-II protein putative isoform 1 [Tripterygium wilfordii]
MASNQMNQMESIFNQFDSSIQGGHMGSGTNNPAHQHMAVSTMHMGLMLPPGSIAPTPQHVPVSNIQNIPSYNPGFQRLSMSNMQMGQLGTQAYGLFPQQILLPNKQLGEMEMSFNNMQNLSAASKRKAPMEPVSNQVAQQNMSMPNKRVAPSEHRPWLMQQVSPSNNTLQSQHLQAPKRTVQLQSAPRKSGPQQSSVQKPHTVQVQSSPKIQTDYRSKLRESLASALELVTQRKNKPSNLGKDSQGGAATGQTLEGSQSVGSGLALADALDQGSKLPKDDSLASEGSSVEKGKDGGSASQENSSNGGAGNSVQNTICDNLGLQSNVLLADEDSFSDNIFAKDELLQGNGLSWVMDPVADLTENKEVLSAKNQKPSNQEVGGVVEEQVDQTPQMLAAKIEDELFKLFGGVNKKYKEKGRSLLFNLKDRNNPELRERVVAGEIPPEKLCNMTAEDLASKELSEWRMAKAEELAQMVVLPDSDVRRLVKKTHKGEFQVEVEPDDSVSVEVSVGASSFTRSRLDTEGKEASPPANPVVKEEERATGDKSKLENSDISCTLTIPSTEGNDLMQGLMVDDGLKDTEFLPPIVSLDEFMESLNSEPPFANLQADEGKVSPKLGKDDLESKSKSPDGLPEDPVQTSPDEVDNIDAIDARSDADAKSGDKNVKSENIPVGVSKGEHVWEGLLQLNVSALAPVFAVFKSGEKVSTKEWPALIELKGRVRLNPFEKFLQELPMSRSRAVMIVHFICKEGSAESDQASIREVGDSYVLDGRVGFAEPSPGVELYLCPTNEKMRQMLGKIVSNDQTGVLDNIDNGLIGVFVLRKLTPTISPNSTSSHHKHSSSKKQHHVTTSSRRREDKDVNMNVNVTPRRPTNPFNKPQTQTIEEDDDDDDVPPGFGAGTARDEDDLPEFNFSTRSTQNPSRRLGQAPLRMHSQAPVDQMRELIYKYGQTQTSESPRTWQANRGIGVPVRQWNDDDDDDIPEWQPQASSQPQISHQHAAVQNFQQTAPMVTQLLPHQQPNVATMYSSSSSVNMMQGQGQQNTAMNTWRGPQWNR